MAYGASNFQTQEASAATTITLTSYNANFGVAGSRILIAFVSHKDNDATAGTRQAAPTSVTFGGVAMTLDRSAFDDNGGTTNKIHIYRLVNPSTSSGNIVATYAVAKDNMRIMAVTLTGVKEQASEAFGSFTGDPAGDQAVSCTTVTANCALIGGVHASSGIDTDLTGCTELGSGAGSNIGYGAGHEQGPTTPGAESFTFTSSSTFRYAALYVAYEIAPLTGTQDARKDINFSAPISPFVGRAKLETIQYSTPNVLVGRDGITRVVQYTPQLQPVIGFLKTLELRYATFTAISDSFSHADRAEARLPSQFFEKEKIHALVRIAGERAQLQRTQTLRMKFLRSLEFATEQQLDDYGSILGIVRGNYTDDVYRSALRAQIRALTSQGTREDVLAVGRELWGSGAAVTVTPNPPGKITISVAGIDPDFLTFHTAMLNSAMPAGGGLTLVFT